MIATHVGADGRTRRIYSNIAHYEAKDSLVVLNSYEEFVDPSEALKNTIPLNYKKWGQYHCEAIINLAQGEYLEWKKDAERS
jgi:hypothetical protein